jgi:hypothetical protein
MSFPDALGWAVLLLGALVGSVIGGVAGFGAGITLVPLIAWVFGIRAVAPVLTITMLVGNLSRIWWSRHEIDRPVALRFLVGGVPATAVGAALYVGTSSEWLRFIIGGFLIAAVPLTTDLAQPALRHPAPAFLLSGGRHRRALGPGGDDRPGDDAVLSGLRPPPRRLHRH